MGWFSDAWDDVKDVGEGALDVATGGLYGYATEGEWNPLGSAVDVVTLGQADELGGAIQDGFDVVSGREAARNAERAALEGNQEARELLQQYYDQSRGDYQSALQQYQDFGEGLGERYAPYTGAGERATALLADASGAGDGSSGFTSLLDLVRSSPDYQFAVQEGQRIIGADASAGGQAMGGSVLRELTRFGQDRATRTLDNVLSRLQSLSGQGLNAANAATRMESNNVGNIANQYGQLGGQTEQLGTNLANLARDRGDIRSSGYTSRYNAGRGFVEDAVNLGTRAAGAMTGNPLAALGTMSVGEAQDDWLNSVYGG